MFAILLRRCLCNRLSQSNVRLPSSKSISDITMKPQALFYYCTYRNFTVFGSKYNFKSSKCSQYFNQNAGEIDFSNQMWGCQVLKALVILLWNHKHCSITVPIGTLRFSAHNTILKAQNARNTITEGACAIDYPNQMWGCQVLKALVILLWNYKRYSIIVPIGTLRFSAQNTILKAQNARNTMTEVPVQSSIPIKCEVAKF
jgi:hypothetical protein